MTLLPVLGMMVNRINAVVFVGFLWFLLLDMIEINLYQVILSSRKIRRVKLLILFIVPSYSNIKMGIQIFYS